ncbi:MAG TPA: amidohydrolase family protein, partial [Chryseolinea sp.]
FAHGQNAYELELMVAYGMNPLEVLRSATSVNAKVFHLDKEVGRIKENLKADILVVTGDPSKNISDLRQVKWVMKDGILYE